jgi:SNF2 family DNA or RNA helicase
MSMTQETSVLVFEHRAGATAVDVSRGPGVPDVLWLKVQTEWGTDGRSPGTGVNVPISVFLSRLDWVAPYCRQHRVSVVWKGTARELVERRLNDYRLLNSALESVVPVDEGVIADELAPSRFVRDLRAFQTRDLGRLLVLANGANFSVPGAGKTSIAYATYEYLRVTERAERMLVVSPLSAFESWEEEARNCFNPIPVMFRFDGKVAGPTEILLVNYHRLELGFSVLAEWVASRKTHLVLDEAHRMKRGWTGEWGRNCLNLANLASRRDILTGTPAPQSVFDLEALFDFVWPGRARYLVPRASRDEAAVREVSRSIAPLFVRTTKQELELPEPLIQTTSQPLDPLHAEIYAAILGRYGKSFPATRRTHYNLRTFGRVVMYLLEAATNPSLLISGSHPYDPILFRHPPLDVPQDTDLDDLLRAYPEYETPWKFRFLKLAVEENAKHGRKTLVWSNFLRNLETLRRHELRDYNPAIVHGGIQDRDDQLSRFRTDSECHVLLANPAALGEGISLHHVCHDAIYLERTFNAGHYLQSVDRIHRLGLHEDAVTRVTILSSAETIDEVVESRLREKTERLGTLLGDPGLSVMSLPAIPEEGLEGDSDLGIDDGDIAEVARHVAR